MGRHLGAFSPLALERLTVQKAGFEARYGSQLTGIVSAEHDLSAAKSFSGSFMVDPVSTNGRLVGAFRGKNGKEGVIMAAMRGSNWGTYQDKDVRSLLTSWSGIDPLITTFWIRQPVILDAVEEISHDVDVNFSDLHIASRYKLNPFHSIHASLYRAVNELGAFQSIFQESTEGEGAFVLFAESEYSWLNWGSQIRHSWLLGDRSALTTQIRGSWHNSSLDYFAIPSSLEENVLTDSLIVALDVFKDSLQTNERARERNKIQDLGMQVNLYHSISPNNHLEVGIEAAHTRSRFSFFQPFMDQVQNRPSNWHWAGYLQNSITIGRRMVITPGVRVTYVPVLSTIYAEPRLSLRMDGIARGFGNYAVRVAGGVYRQFVNQLELTGYGTSTVIPSAFFWLPLDGTLSPSRSYHLALDFMLIPAEQWTIRMEGYSKWLHRTLIYNHAVIQDLEVETGEQVDQSDFIVPTSGRASGVGMSLNYKGAVGAGGISYEFSHTIQRYPGRFNDQMIAVPWQVPHRLKLNGVLRLTGGLQVESTWTQSWGQQWGFRRAYYDVFSIWDPVTSSPLPDFNAPEENTLPGFQRLDLGLTYSWKSSSYLSRIQLYVLNVLDHDNIFDYSIESRPDSFNEIPRYLPGRQYTVSMRLDF